MYNFRKLQIWIRSQKLIKQVYEVSSDFPKEELYGITSQLRRAAISVSLNIAEGSGRSTNKDFRNFLSISLGSSNEVVTLLELCFHFKYIDEVSYNKLIKEYEELANMIFIFRKNLKS